MTISEILADARESLARLTVNGLCSRAHAEKLVREDAMMIMDKAVVEIEQQIKTLRLALLAEKREAGQMILDAALRMEDGRCSYIQTNGTTHWCALAENQSTDNAGR